MMSDENLDEAGDVDAPIAREMRTPITEVERPLCLAQYCFVEIVNELMADAPCKVSGVIGDPAEMFTRLFYCKLDDLPENFDTAVENIVIPMEKYSDVWEMFSTVVAYSHQAIEAARSGFHDEAWALIADANYWAGVLREMVFNRKSGEDTVSENARKAALASHAENHSIAKDVEAWHKLNHLKFTAKDAMAEAATKEIPWSFRTIRKHIGELSKTYPLHAKGKPCM